MHRGQWQQHHAQRRRGVNCLGVAAAAVACRAEVAAWSIALSQPLPPPWRPSDELSDMMCWMAGRPSCMNACTSVCTLC